MAEEIKVVVRQENQGSALKEALRDEEKLKQSSGASAANSEKRAAAEERVAKAKKEQAQTDARPAPVIRDYATQPRGTGANGEPRRTTVDYDAVRAQSDQAAAFMTGEEKRSAAAGQAGSAVDERSQIKQAAFTTALEAQQARAGGDTAGAAALEREAEILNRTLAIQKNLNVSIAEARVLATQQVDAEREMAAAKEKQAEANKKQRADATAARAEAKARVADEQKITQEQREQDKLSSRQRAEALRGGRMVLNAGAGAAGAAGFGGVSSAIGGLAAGPAGIAAAIGTAIATAVGTLIAQELEKRDAIAASEGKAVESRNRRNIIAGKVGAEGQDEASANLNSNRQALEAAVARRGSFRDSGVSDRIKRLFGFETSSQKAERENELEIQRRQKDEREDQKQAVEKFNQGPGGLELEKQRRLIARDRRGAIAIDDEITAQKEYNRVLQETRDYGMAIEAAGNKVFLDQRRRAGEFGHLISARSGAGDIGQAASLASEVLPLREVKSSIDAMHASMRGQHADAQQARTMTRFR